MRRIGICRFRGVVTPYQAVGVGRNDTSSNSMVGEALAYVQGYGLKANAAVSWRSTNSPAAREKSPVAFFVTRELAMGYWEQIGEENRKYREKRAAMHPLRRKMTDGLGAVFLFTISIALWVIMFAPLWFLLAG